jgi:hypothetical protein
MVRLTLNYKKNKKVMISLSNILKLNAISSGLTGLLLLSLPKTLAPVIGATSPTPLIAVGSFLLAFAVFVFEVSLGRPIKSKAVKIVIALDIAWVAVSAIALIFLLPILTVIGNAVVIGIAVWVGGMVYLQKKGLRNNFQNQQAS